MRSTVYLIGAGPGAPDLISLRGYRCLQRADVVIFDHLVHPDLLDVAPAGAERIDVGSAAPERRDQDAICYLLAEKAREGKTVARLKWGDPFLFDRGGEEALFLHEQGVNFEVVPGVPAAVGATAYAGIPITYHGGGDTVKEVGKDPLGDGGGTGIADTLVEGGFPQNPGQVFGGEMGLGPAPFVLATPHQAPQGALAQQYLAAMAARGTLF